MINPLESKNNFGKLAVFPLRHPVKSCIRLALLLACFVLTVFGTYGSMRGSIDVTGDTYLHLAFPSAVALFAMVLSSTWLTRASLSLYPIRYSEGALFVAFYAVTLISLIGSPHKILGTATAAVGAIVMLLSVTNYVRSFDRFLIAVRLLCLYVWLTALVALAAGIQSFYVGPFTVGPIYIEYNQIFWRVNSWFITSTAFGIFLAYGILAAWYLLSVNHRFWIRCIIVVSIALFIFGLGLSAARTPFAVVAIAMLFLAISRLSLRRSHIFTSLMVLIVVTVTAKLVAPYWEEIYVLRRFLLEDSDTASLGGRTEMWTIVSSAILSLSPFQILFGSGLGTFQETMNSTISAHSGLLRILVENGLLGFGIFVCMMTTLIQKLLSLVRSCKGKTGLEQQLLLMFIVLFFSSELLVQQLMGISMDTLIFYYLFGLVLAERKLRTTGRVQSRLVHA